MRVLLNRRGSAVIAATLIGLLLMSGTVWYVSWSRTRVQGDVHRQASFRALKFAESGVDVAMTRLRQPEYINVGETNRLVDNMPVMEQGRVEVRLSRTNANINEVEAISTGYYYLPKGSFVDPGSLPVANRASQRVVVKTKIILHNVGDYFAAVPDYLSIEPGADLGTGSVYARDLVFKPGTSIKVGRAFYLDSITPPTETPPNVVFNVAPLHAERMPVAPNLVYLNSESDAFYLNKANSGGRIMGGPGNNSLKGTVDISLSDPYKVFYCNGDLELGSDTEELTVSNFWVVYSTGNVTIKNRILTPGNAWIGVIARGSIMVADTAPDNMTINGNFVTNGAFSALGGPRPLNSVFTFTGGFLAHEGANFSTAWGAGAKRTYKYKTLPNEPTFLLPNFTEMVEFVVLQGKYSR